MRIILTFIITIFFACNMNNINTNKTIKQDPLEINAIKKKKTFGIPRQKSIAINIKGKVFTFSLNIVMTFSVNCMSMTAP